MRGLTDVTPLCLLVSLSVSAHTRVAVNAAPLRPTGSTLHVGHVIVTCTIGVSTHR